MLLLRDEKNSNRAGLVWLGKINCIGQFSEWGTKLIKSQRYFMCKRQESSYGVVVGTQAMLVG